MKEFLNKEKLMKLKKREFRNIAIPMCFIMVCCWIMVLILKYNQPESSDGILELLIFLTAITFSLLYSLRKSMYKNLNT